MNGEILPIIFVSLIFLIILFFIFIIRHRGEAVRFWVQPVPYFRGIRHNRPIKLKITRGVGRTLDKNLVKTFDRIIFETKEGSPSQVVTEKKAKDVPEDLFEAWKEIRQHPEKYTIWAFFFMRRWRTPQGLKGRWVYAYSLFSIEEMAKDYLRHRLVQGVFVEKPLGVHYPPTKDEWVLSKIKEDTAKGLKLSKDRVRAYEKEYRRISKEKWLALVFHPTVTAIGQAEVMNRLTGFENLMAVTAHAMNALGTELAKYKALAHFSLGREEFERKLVEEVHETQDRYGALLLAFQAQTRAIKEKTVPTIVSMEGPPMPTSPFPEPRIEHKPDRFSKIFEGLSDVDILNWLLIVFGLFTTTFGYVAYLANPKMWGSLAFGAVMFLIGVITFIIRKHKTIKVPEPIAEKPEEMKETVTGE